MLSFPDGPAPVDLLIALTADNRQTELNAERYSDNGKLMTDS
jgi:hypothetical protein